MNEQYESRRKFEEAYEQNFHIYDSIQKDAAWQLWKLAIASVDVPEKKPEEKEPDYEGYRNIGFNEARALFLKALGRDMSQKEEKSDVSKEHVISNDINKLVISNDMSGCEIRVPKDDFIETRQDDGTLDKYVSLNAIRRLNANAKITEVSDE